MLFWGEIKSNGFGTSLVFATVIVNGLSTVAVPSLTINTTELAPTLSFVGVPLIVAVPSNVNQDGKSFI